MSFVSVQGVLVRDGVLTYMAIVPADVCALAVMHAIVCPDAGLLALWQCIGLSHFFHPTTIGLLVSVVPLPSHVVSVGRGRGRDRETDTETNADTEAETATQTQADK